MCWKRATVDYWRAGEEDRHLRLRHLTTFSRPVMAKHAGADEGKPWIRLVLTLAILGGLAYVARLLMKAINEGVE